MSPFVLILCLLAGTSWAFVPDDPDFRGYHPIGYSQDELHSLPNPFASFSDTAQQNPEEEMVTKFLARMTRSIRSGDIRLDLGLFQPSFVFEICGDKFNKYELAGFLSTFTPDNEVSFTLLSVLDAGNHIKFNSTAIGISSYPMEVEFLLNVPDQQLAYGKVHKCPVPRDSQPED
ncbi:hypothetical protein B9Z55_028048 [Caenorhabditis nigoni]|uniref:NTF2-like domain-containing protein n=1 Tax=Caenorhabditis nigoni TaxID=1611254 RepID=A0A2G5SDI3_9PELO|nr:hypothetical protein B9Z55_028048 [Caenorhabditis nigoni]